MFGIVIVQYIIQVWFKSENELLKKWNEKQAREYQTKLKSIYFLA